MNTPDSSINTTNQSIQNNPSINTHKSILNSIEDSLRIKTELMKDASSLLWIETVYKSMVQSLSSPGGIIFWAGNGGSFSDALHLSAEFVGRFKADRRPLSSIALGSNPSMLTAVGNDYSFEDVFTRELEAFGKSKDTLIVLSTSGNSANIIKLVTKAQSKNIPTFGLSGQLGGALRSLIPTLCIPTSHTARIQECHIMIGHILCELIEESYRQGEFFSC